LEQELAADPPPLRLRPNLAQVYRGEVERLHEALADPGLRDEALGILRGLIERVVIHPAKDGLQVEIVGESVKEVELGVDAKQAALPREAACSVKVVAGAGFEPCRTQPPVCSTFQMFSVCQSTIMSHDPPPVSDTIRPAGENGGTGQREVSGRLASG
jgi:hypothetical protein